MSLTVDITVPFNAPALGDEEARAAADAVRLLASDGRSRFGREVECRLRSLTGAPHALLVTSCTHALELALMALGIGPGDEVIVPSFTFSSTATAVIRQSAVPVFADITPDTWNLDPADVACMVTPRTRAVIPIHYGGQPADCDQLRAAAPGCLIIEDAAHALGARRGGRAAGTLGDAGCFSFHATKNVTCGEGGALLLHGADLARRAEWIREKGTNRSEFERGEVSRYVWVSEGSSYVASDVLAAILLPQLAKLAAIVGARGERWHRYRTSLARLEAEERLVLPRLEADVDSSYHIFAVLLSPDRRARVQEQLQRRGIATATHYQPLHRSPFWTSRVPSPRPLPVTERVSESLLRLPLYPSLTMAQQTAVVEQLEAACVE